MTSNIPNYRLIDFLHKLHEIHQDPHACFEDFNQIRCRRWMDAVLPPESEQQATSEREDV